MGLDAVFKRLFPAVVLVSIGVAAYFQASGMGQLVAGSMAVDPSTVPAMAAPPALRASPPPASTDHTTDGSAILSRNPFDSVTGPLDGSGGPSDETPPPAAETDGPLPACAAARVVLITWSEDPEWSFASIAGSDGKSLLRRRGDDVDGQKIDEIQWDRVTMSSGAGKRCQMVIGEEMTAAQQQQPTGGREAEPPGRRPIKSTVPPEISSRIHRIDDTHFVVERQVIDEILGRIPELLGPARVTPGKGGDEGGGLRIAGVRPGSLLESLGVKNGDSLQSVNGIDLSDPKNAVEAYPKLRAANKLTVSLRRGGKPTTIDIQIQ